MGDQPILRELLNLEERTAMSKPLAGSPDRSAGHAGVPASRHAAPGAAAHQGQRQRL
jgi:hypothetical protein